MIDVTSGALIILVFFIAIFTVVSIDTKAPHKFIIMTCLFLAGALSYRSINSRAGLPLVAPNLNKEEVLMLGFYAEKENKRIYIWIKQAGSSSPQSFVFRYSNEAHSKLRGLRDTHKGKPYYIKMSSDKTKIGYRFKNNSEALIKIESSDIEMPSK